MSSTDCQRTHWKEGGHRRACVEWCSDTEGTWVTLDLTRGFYPVVEHNPEKCLVVRSTRPGSEVVVPMSMGIKEYEAAVDFMLKEYDGKHFCIKAQTPPQDNMAIQIYDASRTLLCFVRPDISGEREYRSLERAVKGTAHGRRGYFDAVIVVEKKEGTGKKKGKKKGKKEGRGRTVLKVRVDLELAAKNTHW
mgnify:CR=1 FL=1